MYVPFSPFFTPKMTRVGGDIKYWYRITTRLTIQTPAHFKRAW